MHGGGRSRPRLPKHYSIWGHDPTSCLGEHTFEIEPGLTFQDFGWTSIEQNWTYGIFLVRSLAQLSPWRSKHFIGSSFTSVIESNLPSVVGAGGSVEAKFNWLTTLYLSYFRMMGKNPYITEISRETMGLPMGTTCPIARWSKGQASTEMMHFLEYFCRVHIVNKTTDPLLLSIVSWYQTLKHFLFWFEFFWG